MYTHTGVGRQRERTTIPVLVLFLNVNDCFKQANLNIIKKKNSGVGCGVTHLIPALGRQRPADLRSAGLCQLREYKKILSQNSFLKINYKQWAREVAGVWGGVRRGQP